MSAKVDRLRAQLEKAYQVLEQAKAASSSAESRAEANTINDPGALSGIRRKPNRRADDRRYSAYAKAAETQQRLDRARNDIIRLQRALAAAEAEEARVPLTRDDIAGADVIRTANGWHRIVRVNAKSVTVQTPYSWTDRIDIDAILEARSIGGEA